MAATRTGKTRNAHDARMAMVYAEVKQALADNRCPRCAQAVRRNLALTGWVQCSGFGADGFRAAGSTPCSWQGFTGE